MDVLDPIRDAQDRFAAMQAGTFDRITPHDPEVGLAEARAWLEGGRRLGSGVIKTMPLYEGDDWLPVWVAITDGERVGAIMITLNGSAVAVASNAGENPSAHCAGASPEDEHPERAQPLRASRRRTSDSLLSGRPRLAGRSATPSRD
jgi:hypothetical protein